MKARMDRPNEIVLIRRKIIISHQEKGTEPIALSMNGVSRYL
jgi:hypothetical protein